MQQIAPLERAALNARRRAYPRARAGYSQAIRIQPDNATAYVNRALSYRQRGNRAAALADLQKVVLLTRDLALRGQVAEQLRALPAK